MKNIDHPYNLPSKISIPKTIILIVMKIATIRLGELVLLRLEELAWGNLCRCAQRNSLCSSSSASDTSLPHTPGALRAQNNARPTNVAITHFPLTPGALRAYHKPRFRDVVRKAPTSACARPGVLRPIGGKSFALPHRAAKLPLTAGRRNSLRSSS